MLLFESVHWRIVIVIEDEKKTRITCISIVLTVDRYWRWWEIRVDRIKHHSTNSIHAYLGRAPGLVIRSKGVGCTGDWNPICSTFSVYRAYWPVWANNTKWHGVRLIYCKNFQKGYLFGCKSICDMIFFNFWLQGVDTEIKERIAIRYKWHYSYCNIKNN